MQTAFAFRADEAGGTKAMLIKQILDSKPDSEILTVGPDASVSDAAKILSKRRIGALVVSTDGKRALGIISERDIVRELGRSGTSCMKKNVDQYMSRTVVTCTEDETADQALAKMTEGRFRHLPVVKDEDMIGFISIGDVVKARLMDLSMEKEALEGMIMGH